MKAAPLRGVPPIGDQAATSSSSRAVLTVATDLSFGAEAFPAVALAALPALRLLQLVSPSLPTGAFAYSQGLEAVLDLGWVSGEVEAAGYLETLLSASLATLDLPLVLRLHTAWERRDVERAAALSAWLLASRESGELQAQERQMASALARVLREIRPAALAAAGGRLRAPTTFAEALTAAAVAFGLSAEATLLGYAYTWCESHVAALAKLLPLGPIAGQRVLDRLLRRVPEVVAHARLVGDDAVGASAPGLAVASALHETQHTRLFRS